MQNNVYLSDEDKANAFVKEYARVSHLQVRVEVDRYYDHTVLKSHVLNVTNNGTDVAPSSQLKNYDVLKASGLVGVSNKMFQHIHDLGTQHVLD